MGSPEFGQARSGKEDGEVWSGSTAQDAIQPEVDALNTTPLPLGPQAPEDPEPQLPRT